MNKRCWGFFEIGKGPKERRGGSARQARDPVLSSGLLTYKTFRQYMGVLRPVDTQFTGTVSLSLCPHSSRRQPELPAGPCRYPVRTCSKRHRSGALARHDSGSPRRENVVDHRSMTAISIRGESRPFVEDFLPVGADRMAATSRWFQCTRCCVQSPDGTQPTPWTGCARPRCCWSPRGRCGSAGCRSKDWERGRGALRDSFRR